MMGAAPVIAIWFAAAQGLRTNIGISAKLDHHRWRSAELEGVLLRICITCDRYADSLPTSGERLAQAVADALDLRPDLDLSVLRVACLNGCKHSCQTMLTGREPVRIGDLRPEDAKRILDIAVVYCCGGDVLDIVRIDKSACLAATRRACRND